MKEINCLGDMCPIPILKALQTLETLNSGDSFKLVTDHSCVVESVKDRFSRTRHSANVEEVMCGVWEIVITKN